MILISTKQSKQQEMSELFKINIWWQP